MYHYNYKITNVETKEYYIGVRSCKCNIEDDPYMGSSSIWTKIYIKEHKDVLVKEILEVFETRKLANIGEVTRLKQYQEDPLCINQYFDYTPDVTGTKQTPEWIEKRKLFGERNGMFGKHHTEEAKKAISEKLKGRIITEEARKKIGDWHRGKFVSDETKAKIKKHRRKIRKIVDIITNEEFIMSIDEFCELHPELRPGSMRQAASHNYLYHKRYKILEYAAT